MGWRRYKRKASRQLKRTGQQASDQLSKFQDYKQDAWKRYKDEIITIGATALGGIVGSIVPGVGTALGAAAGASLAQGARGAYKANKAENAADAQARSLEQSMGNMYERRKMRRAGGDAVIDYDSNVPTGSSGGAGAAA